MINSALDNLADPANGTIFPIELPELSNRYNVNVPIADAAGQFAAWPCSRPTTWSISN